MIFNSYDRPDKEIDVQQISQTGAQNIQPTIKNEQLGLF